MSRSDETKKGNYLTVERGGRYGVRDLTPDEWLEREMQTLMASWKASNGSGPYASRAIANAAQRINFPHRIPARRIREAREKHVRHELVRRLGLLLAEYADRLYQVSVTPDKVA